MSIESIAISEWEDRLKESIRRHGLTISSREFMAVLADVAEPSRPITLPERAFLTEHAGLSDEDLTTEALREVDAEIARDRAVAARDVQSESLNTQQVAEMLGMAPPNVRRAVTEGALYSVKTSPGSHHWFPEWQFPHRRILPGLREVISALPRDYHPIEVESFMTEASDELRGMSPVIWLANGGDVAEVVALADERAWE